MSYVLKVFYETGDSFGHYNTEETIDYGWEDVDVAMENAKAITEHYNVYDKEHRFGWVGVKEEDRTAYKDAWWYEDPKDSWFGDIGPGIHLKLDDGRLVRYFCPWCGYFETLRHVEVSIKEMIFYPEF